LAVPRDHSRHSNRAFGIEEVTIVVKALLVCVALLASVHAASATVALYHCADGTTVRAVFSAPGPAGTATLRFTGKRAPVRLAQAPSADGGRYRNGAMEFWVKGNGARLTRTGASTECETK
jgi:membrane-bound inhibitor of C-type lysozyme